MEAITFDEDGDDDSVDTFVPRYTYDHMEEINSQMGRTEQITIKDTDILIDTGSNCSVFHNSELLLNIRRICTNIYKLFYY